MSNLLDLDKVRNEGVPLFGETALVSDAKRALLSNPDDGAISYLGPHFVNGRNILAVVTTFSNSDMRDYYRRAQSEPDSWCDCRKFYWAGHCWLRDVTDRDDLVKVLSDDSDRIELYFVNKESYDKIATHTFPITHLTYAEAEERGEIDQIVGISQEKAPVPTSKPAPAATHVPRPDEGIYVEKRTVKANAENAHDSAHTVVTRFLAVRRENIESGAHAIPLVRITPGGSVPSFDAGGSEEEKTTTRDSSCKNPPPLKSFTVTHEAEAQKLLTHYRSYLKQAKELDSDIPDISTRNAHRQQLENDLGKDEGALEFFRNNKILILGTPIEAMADEISDEIENEQDSDAAWEPTSVTIKKAKGQ